MDVPPFLRSRPVPVRARHDGWTPVVQPRFILLLARGAGTDEAARRVGKRRQTAYALRKKAGAEAFAAAWDEALEFARLTREAAAAPADAMRPRNHAHAALLSWSSGRLHPAGDRKSAVSGKSVTVCVAIGSRRLLNHKIHHRINAQH